MLRRLVALATALIASIAVPATMASADTDDFMYPPSEYALTLSITTATVGVPFTVNVTGPSGNGSFTLEVPGIADSAIDVAGAQTAATSGGAAAFTVTLPEEGTYTLTATDAEGQVAGTASVTAVAAEDGNAAPVAVGDDSGTTSTGSTLPVTGAASMPYLLAAAVLVVLGVGALAVARLRTRGHRAAAGDRSS